MQLERIASIRGHGVFQDFTWPQELGTFKRWNVVYGLNGTGKTTLSNLLRLLQDRENLKEGEARFEIENRTVRASVIQAEAAPLPQVKVFNRDTVSVSLFENPANSQLPPIFVVGADKVALQKELADLQTKHPFTADAAVAAGKAADDALRTLNKFATEKAKSIKELLTAQGGEFNFFDAAKFREEILAIGDPTAYLLSETERDHLLHGRNAQPMGKLGEAHTVPADTVALVTAVHKLLATTAISKVIEVLAKNPALSGWVSTGFALHKHLDASSCLFCTAPLRPERVQALEAHFNDRFKAFSEELDTLETQLSRAAQSLQLKGHPDNKLLYSELRAGYLEAVHACERHFRCGQQAFTALAAVIAVKRQRMFETPLLDQALALIPDLTVEQRRCCAELAEVCAVEGKQANDWLGLTLVQHVNSFIKTHNKTTDDFGDIAKESRRRLMRDAVATALPEWQKLSAVKASAEEKKKTSEEAQRSEISRIRELKAAIQQHAPAAEDINRDLLHYLGHKEIQVEAAETGYRLVRAGRPAKRLSEGERTAIAFIYFLRSLKDQSFDSVNGIVVIDDPVSSLDANSSFCAFGFMKSRLKDVGQLFILTHNHMLLRSVLRWLSHLPGKGKHCGYYMLQCELGENGRSSRLAGLDPLLTEYESDYHYLFKKVMEGSEMSAQLPLEAYYQLPNIARRLLETFVAFRVPTRDKLHAKFDKLPGDPAIKARIYQFVQSFSHDDAIGDGGEGALALAEGPVVLKSVLELIRAADPDHYERMKEALGAP